jgi:hypothetical protein
MGLCLYLVHVLLDSNLQNGVKMGLQKMFILTIIILALWVSPAYAYLDPGTGSILLQAVLAGIAAGITTISLYWKKIKAIFSKSENTPKDRM